MESLNASSTPSLSLPSGMDISSSIDGMFYGYAIATVLFGITVVQAWIYINTNRDRWPLRCLVGMLFLMDFTTTCLDTAVLHQYLVSNFGNLANLTTVSSFLVVEVLLTLIIVLCVEIFFASRVYLIDRLHWVVPALIVLTAVVGFAVGIAGTIEVYEGGLFFSTLENRKEEIIWPINMGLAALCDVTVTTALSWAFARSRVGIQRTDNILQKLFHYTITRGFFVTADQTILLIMFFVDPNGTSWMPFHLSLSKVYVITMVAMLNSRDALQNLIKDASIVVTDIEIPRSGGVGISSVNGRARSRVMHESIISGEEGRSRTRQGSVINFASFVTTEGRKGADVGDNDVEMDNCERKGVLITREIVSEVI